MSSPATRRRVPGLRRLLLILLALAVVAGLGAAAYFSPVLSARDVSVTGATNAPADRVAAVVEPLKGRPLLQITPGQRDAYAAQVIAVSPWIDRATVTVSYPSTLVVEVTEREVVAYAQRPAGTVLVDAAGRPVRPAHAGTVARSAASRSATEPPRWWSEIAVTRSALRMREPPAMPS